jgi:glycosyltransferase involved in cell wall biosynthesis
MISVLIPAYNVEKYLPECLDSVLAQTYRNFEIVIVNDGSADKTGAICDYYASVDSRIIVVHQKNMGVSAARNACLDASCGEYVAFVDADDLIAPDYLDKLLMGMKSGADFSACGIKVIITDSFLDGDPVLRGWRGNSETAIVTHRISGLCGFDMSRALSENNGILCGKMLRRQVIDKLNLMFPVDLMWEDLYGWFIYATQCKNAFYIRDKLYFYKRNGNSITSNAFVAGSKLLQYISILEALHDYLARHDLYEKNFGHYWNVFRSCVTIVLRNVRTLEQRKDAGAQIVRLINKLGENGLDDEELEWLEKNFNYEPARWNEVPMGHAPLRITQNVDMS